MTETAEEVKEESKASYYILVVVEGDGETKVITAKTKKEIVDILEVMDEPAIIGLFKGKEIPMTRKLTYVI